jgi:putative addiction module component (TIGR02574 family)
MIATEEIIRMTPAERLETMERLWQSLAPEELPVEPPQWHERVLQERTQLMNDGHAHWLSLEELKQRLLDPKVTPRTWCPAT